MENDKIDEETQLRDWITRYGLLQGRRYTLKERVNAVNTLSREMKRLGYQTAIVSEESRIAGARQQFYNLYAGDLERADVVITTYYDTPVRTFGAYKERAFQLPRTRTNLLLNFLPSTAVFVLALILIYGWLLPEIQRAGWGSAWIFPFLAVVLIGLYFINRYRSGVPRRYNLVRNSSGLLTLLQLAAGLESHERVAFAFVDGGTTSGHGLAMARAYFKHGRRRFVSVDSVGNAGPLLCLSDHRLTLPDGVARAGLPADFAEVGEVLVTAGQLGADGVLIRKSQEIDLTRIGAAAALLEAVVQGLL